MRGESPRVEYVALGTLLRYIEAGKSPAAEDTPAGIGEWGVLKVSAVQRGCFAADENKVIRDASLIQPQYEVRPGDLLMTRANTEDLVGLACIAHNPPQRLMLSDKTLRLVIDKSAADAKFTELVLSRPSTRAQIRAMATGTSGSMKNIGQAAIRQLKVPYFPIVEQRRIVAAHAAIERRIATLERLAAKRLSALDSLIEQLLWLSAADMKTVKAVSSSIDAGITLGAHRAPQRKATEYLRVANVRKGWIDTRDIAVLEADERDRPRYELISGDVLIVEGHANPEQIGRAAVVSERENGMLYQNHLYRIRFTDVVPEYAMLWLNSAVVRSYWKSRCATSSGLYTVNSKLLGLAPFPRVSMSEQRQVVGAWRSAHRSVEDLQEQVTKLRVVQEGLLEDLLSGRVRVPQSELLREERISTLGL